MKTEYAYNCGTLTITNVDHSLYTQLTNLVDAYNNGQLLPDALICGFKQCNCVAWDITGDDNYYMIDITGHRQNIDLGHVQDGFDFEDLYDDDDGKSYALVRKIL